MTIQQDLITHIAAEWLGGDAEGLDADVSLTELNVIDSAAIFDLVHHLQATYRISIPLGQVVPDNFETVRSIASLVERLRQAEGAAR
jgi:peptidyl carrier protein